MELSQMVVLDFSEAVVEVEELVPLEEEEEEGEGLDHVLELEIWVEEVRVREDLGLSEVEEGTSQAEVASPSSPVLPCSHGASPRFHDVSSQIAVVLVRAPRRQP